MTAADYRAPEQAERDAPAKDQDASVDYRERVRVALAAFMAATPTRALPRRWTNNKTA